MTFRTRLVLATTVAVVVAVLAASSAAFLVARNTLLQAADNSLTTAAQKIVAGQQIGATTATQGQVINSSGAVVSGGGLPVTGQVRLVAVNLAPAFFTTVTVDGNQMRELVEHLPDNTPVDSGVLVNGGALQIATLFNANSELKTLALLLGVVALIGVLLAVVLGWLVARTGARPAELAHRHRRGRGRDDRRARVDSRPEGPTSSAGSGVPSTACSKPSSPRGAPRASWSSTPPTSCAPRSPACGPTSR